MQTAWPTQPLQGWWRLWGQQVWGPCPCNCRLTSPWPTLVDSSLPRALEPGPGRCALPRVQSQGRKQTGQRKSPGRGPWSCVWAPTLGGTHADPASACPHPGSGWMRGQQGAERGVLNLNIQKTKIMSSSPITLWQIDGETVETVADFF